MNNKELINKIVKIIEEYYDEAPVDELVKKIKKLYE